MTDVSHGDNWGDDDNNNNMSFIYSQHEMLVYTNYISQANVSLHLLKGKWNVLLEAVLKQKQSFYTVMPHISFNSC